MNLWEWELVRRREVEGFSHEVPTFLSAVMVGWLHSGKGGKKPQGGKMEITEIGERSRSSHERSGLRGQG